MYGETFYGRHTAQHQLSTSEFSNNNNDKFKLLKKLAIFKHVF